MFEAARNNKQSRDDQVDSTAIPSQPVLFEPLGLILRPDKTVVDSILFYCACTGGWFGALASAVGRSSVHYEFSVVGAAILAFPFGMAIGLVCTPFVHGAFSNRDSAKAKLVTIVIMTPIVAGTAYVVPPSDLGILLLLSAVTFVLSAILARLVLPRRWNSPGLCSRCGYDLRASAEFDRCPECGPREQSVQITGDAGVHARGRRGRWDRIGQYCVRHPLQLLALVTAIMLVSPYIEEATRSRRTQRIEQAVRDALDSKPLNLDLAAPFDWDEVFIRDRYGPTDALADRFASRKLVGLPISGIGTHLIIFVRDGVCVEWVQVDFFRTVANHEDGYLTSFCSCSLNVSIPREEAVFMAIKDSNGRIEFCRPKIYRP